MTMPVLPDDQLISAKIESSLSPLSGTIAEKQAKYEEKSKLYIYLGLYF
jgi:hypothetical protein